MHPCTKVWVLIVQHCKVGPLIITPAAVCKLLALDYILLLIILRVVEMLKI